MDSEWTEIFNGKDLTGWRMRHTDREHAWVAHDGVLENTKHAVDIITEDDNFVVHIKFASHCLIMQNYHPHKITRLMDRQIIL